MSHPMSSDAWSPLPREEVVKAVERRGPSRIPLIQARWWGEGLREQYGDRLNVLEERYPQDAALFLIDMVEPETMDLPWEVEEAGALDAQAIIDDWDKLDAFLERLPDPERDPQFDVLVEKVERARSQDRYVIFGWWRLFFERPWEIRGMTRLLMDYHLHPQEVHRLHEALCDLYCRYLERGIELLQPDAFWTSDDLGHQKQLFMSPDTFRTFLKPYYARVGEVVERHGLHWWLHSCGDNTPVLEDLIEIGVDVFHPVQHGTMDTRAVAEEYGDRLTFLAGIDVQHALQERDPEGVREAVRELVDTFDRPDGGMCIAAGNGIVAGTPFENIEAFLDEAVRYGTVHRRRLAAERGEMDGTD